MDQGTSGEVWKLKELKALYKECQSQPALAAQVMYVIRLQNEMAQMDGQISHSYEKLIFERAMHIFLKHFTEQIQCVLDLDKSNEYRGNDLVIRKHVIIEDIQSAVIKMVEIFQSITGSMRNVEQPIFPVITGNMYVFNASPKVITAYSQILNAMTERLKCSGQYAFLLYPTMSDIIYTDVLFKKRDKGGKVIVVTFPERLAEHPSVIPILFHEAFHVVERNIRCRKLRGRCYWENILQQIEESILGKNIVWQMEDDKQEKLKDNLFDKWFGTVTNEFLDWLNNLQETDRILYAERLVKEVETRLSRELIKIETKIYDDLETELLSLYQSEDKLDFGGYCDVTDMLHACEPVIRSNMISLMAGNMLYESGEVYMDIYREGYADVAACLFLKLSPEDYDSAFRLSCQFEVSAEDYVDKQRAVRQYIVSEALSTVGDVKVWGAKAAECKKVIWGWKMNTVDQDKESAPKSDLPKKVSNTLNPIVLQSFKIYFHEVASRLYAYFETIPDIEEFRSTVQKVMRLDEDTMMKIFLGCFNL